ncbi:MAG: hypothetical protein SFW36_03060 [Leptolyngbyaceae cyanobacterium bins.59]|nr:hypothetical protein [Leptolyngbyaceae cyanobacterium bins.59]
MIRKISKTRSTSILDRIPLSTLLPCSSLALIAYLTRHGLILPTLAIGFIACLLLRREMASLLNFCQRRMHNHWLLFQGLLCAGLTGLLLLDSASMPAQAQFMGKAQNFFEDFTRQAGVDKAVTDLVFNTLRGLFLLYLGIALIRVVQAARNDEDWQTLARTPLIIVVAVVVADVLTGFIVG